MIGARGWENRFRTREALPPLGNSCLSGFQEKGRFLVFLNRPVAEPPVYFLPIDERLDLVLGMRVEDSPGDPPRQYGQDLLVIA